MILESRKWRLIVPGLALLITTLLILVYSNLASYALQADQPQNIYGIRSLAKSRLDGRFAVLRGQADLDRAVALHRNGRTMYWVPVRGYTDKEGAIHLFILTDDIYAAPTVTSATGQETAPFVGRLVRFDDAPYAQDAQQALTPALDDPVADDTYVLIEGDAPKAYRPMVPLVGGLGLVWFGSLVVFVRVWRRVPRRR